LTGNIQEIVTIDWKHPGDR